MEDIMIRKADMPKREATVKTREANVGADWRPFLDIDPIMIPVENGGLADVFDGGLAAVVDVLCELESAFSEHRTDAMMEYTLVWSDDDSTVKGMCPGCDKTFPVAEGFVGDQDNEGYDAVACGCYDG